MKDLSKHFRPFAIVMAIVLVALIAADFFIGQKGSNVDAGAAQETTTSAGVALFFIGLIVGIVAGIVLFFAHMVRREKKLQEEKDELALLLDEVSRDDTVFDVDDWMSAGEQPEFQEDNTHPLDPWERGADWWKNA